MRRGEIWWAAPSVAGGRRKRRPVVVVSNEIFNTNERYNKVVVVPLTSIERPGGPYSWEVALPRGMGGLDKRSVVKCAEIYTLLKEQLHSRVGALTRDTLDKVDRALLIALGLPST